MRLRVSSVLLALFAGCTARAGFIQFNDVITSGEGTFYFTAMYFTATVQGPAMGASFTTSGGSPLYGVSVGGDAPYCCRADGGFTDAGLHLGCYAYPYSPNCTVGMLINLIDTPTVTGFLNNGYEIESQPFTASVFISGCNGPSCPTDTSGSCLAAGTNCFNGIFLGGGTATITLYPPPWPGAGYGDYEAVFDFVAIPEPSSMLLAALGLAGIALARRRWACE